MRCPCCGAPLDLPHENTETGRCPRCGWVGHLDLIEEEEGR